MKLYDASINQADAELREISTSTDLYYDITDLNGKTVVINNAGSVEEGSTDGILSITNIKTTYSSDTEKDADGTGYVMSLATVALALNSFAQKIEEPATVAPTEATADEPVEIPTESSADETEPVTTPVTTAPEEPTQSITSTQATEPVTAEPTKAPTENSTESPTEAPTNPEKDYLSGDANLDNSVNIKDATEIQKHVAELITLSGTALKAADYDLSGNINIKDATAIQKFIAGIFD